MMTTNHQAISRRDDADRVRSRVGRGQARAAVTRIAAGRPPLLWSMMRMAGRAALLIVLVLGTSRGAAALTILDVIQLSQRNYSDAQILAIIDATNSVFELDVEDLPRLKQLGVSEVVIRAMLKRRPPPSPQVSDEQANAAVGAASTRPDFSATAPIPSASLADVARRAKAQGRTAWSTNAPSPVSTVRPARSTTAVPPRSIGNTPGPLAGFFPVAEDRAGHHAHVAVALGGLEVFVLRDEASYGSIADRAEALAAQLEAARARGDGEFRHASIGGKDTVVFRSADGQTQVVITSVTPRDARAYEIRSARKVGTTLLARYWADLLSDYWSIIVVHSAPKRLTGLHDGEALTALFRGLDKDTENDRHDVQTLIGMLPSSVQYHLRQLARAVPIDYGNGGKEGL